MNSNADFKMIAELDLAPIKVKLMHKESGEGWSLNQTNAVEFEYRRFLYLMKLFPHEQTAPLFDVDVFWHYHILDTMKYAADCEQVFGYFLHHFPYSGLRGDDDAQDHLKIGARMQELYEATFGEAYIRQPDSNAAAAPRPEVNTQAAWCQGASPTTAWCQGVAAKSAWCQGVAAKSAWCQGVATKSAWCQGVAAKTAWCQGVTAKTAWCQGMAPITALPQAIAQNDSFYLAPPILARAA